MSHRLRFLLLLTPVLLLVSCSKDNTQVLHTFPISDAAGLVEPTAVVLDKDITSDGNGSFRIDAQAAATIPLYIVDSVGVDNCRLLYRAKLRTEKFDGSLYLEMLCHFPGKGEFFSRNLDQSLSGTNGWVTSEATFFLQQGQIPDQVKLNVGVIGIGTVWVDQIELLKAPL